MMLLLISLTDTLICMSHQSQIHSHAYLLYSKIIHGLVILFTVSLEMNMHLWDVHVPQVCWIPQQRRTVCSRVRNAPLRRAFHSSVLCASLILVYPYCSKSFECTDCTWTWSAHSGANFCPGSWCLWQHDQSSNLLQPERKLSPSKRSEQAFYILS